MPTDTERREVAERLREEGRVLAKLDEGSETASLTLDDVLGVSHDGTWEDQFDCLADLIDPTCEMVDVEKEPGGYQGTGLCSKCGELLLPAFAFCPQCGSRVTNGGER